MENTTVLVQSRIKGDVVQRVKDAGYGKFAIGLYVLLAELDRLKGAESKRDDLEASKGARPSSFKEDPRLKRLPGEHQAKYNARLVAYVESLPETIRAKMVHKIESRIRNWNQHWGKLRPNGEPVNVDDYTKYEPDPFGFGMTAGETIFDYITKERMDACMAEGKAEYVANMASIQKAKPIAGRRPELTADSRHMYQHFPALLVNLTDEQIETMNEECDGALDRGDEPIQPN